MRIRYDKSGRSTGEAIVAFESSEDADRAIEEFNGKTAKGRFALLIVRYLTPYLDQTISVEPYGYFTVDPPSHAGPSSGDNTGSLLSRLGSKVNSGPIPTGPRWVYDDISDYHLKITPPIELRYQGVQSSNQSQRKQDLANQSQLLKMQIPWIK